MKTKLTSSRLAARRKCPRLHYYRYELGLARIREATPLRLGRRVPQGSGAPLLASSARTRRPSLAPSTGTHFHVVPDWADPIEWAVERETLQRSWPGTSGGTAATTSTTSPSSSPSRSRWSIPATGGLSQRFPWPARSTASSACPTAGWRCWRTRPPAKTSARPASTGRAFAATGRSACTSWPPRLGFDVAAVLYDVTRKPTIRLRRARRPRNTPSGSRRISTPGRTTTTSAASPALEDELAEFQAELWQQAHA